MSGLTLSAKIFKSPNDAEVKALKTKTRAILPWVAVATTSVALFVGSFLNKFPLPVRQVLGDELTSYAIGELILSLALFFLLGRLSVLVLREPVFGLLRLGFVQFPLQIAVHLPRRIKWILLRILARILNLIDLLYSMFVSLPNEVSFFLGCIFYFRASSGSWRATFAFAFIILAVVLSAEVVQNTMKKGLRLRYRHPDLITEMFDLQVLSYATSVLTAAFLIGQIEAEQLIKERTLVNFNGEEIEAILVLEDTALSMSEVSRTGDERWVVQIMKQSQIEVIVIPEDQGDDIQ